MASFEYRALTLDGRPRTGFQVAESEAALDRALETEGLCLLSADEVKPRRADRRARLSRRDRITLSTQLAALLDAGVPMLAALRGLAGRMRTPVGQRVVGTLAERIEGGSPLSDALDEFPRSFSEVLRASARAGEMTGELPAVLGTHAAFEEWVQSTRSTTLQVLVYPALLVVAIIALVIVMLTFVLPRIIGMMPGGEDSLPGVTKVLLQVSSFLRANALVLAAGSLGAAGLAALALRRPALRVRVSRALLRVPRLGDLLRMMAVSRFARVASTLHHAGCSALTVLEVASSACGNPAFAAAFGRGLKQVRRGHSLSEALEEEDLMDPLLVQMTRVGEETGRLDACFDRVSSYYDAEVPRQVKLALSLLEPAILVTAGAVVGFILLAALLPMLSIYENLG